MKHVALTLCAAVAVMALSAGTTFAVMTWAPERLPQGTPGERGATGPAGPKGPRGVTPTTATTTEVSSEIADLQNAQRIADERLRQECMRLNKNSGGYSDDEPYEKILQARSHERYNDLECSQQ